MGITVDTHINTNDTITLFVSGLEFQTENDPQDREDIEVVWDDTTNTWVLIILADTSLEAEYSFMSVLGEFGIVGKGLDLHQTRKI